MNYDVLYRQLGQHGLSAWLANLPATIDANFNTRRWGDIPRWLQALEALPPFKPSHIDLDKARITIGKTADITAEQQQALKQTLKLLHPWRKGPFDVFGIHIDTEWRSDWKWDRIKNHIAPLQGKSVLDVGCGSGYHCWRMAGAGAALVIGIDPTPLFIVQYRAIQHFINDPRVWVVPAGIQDMPEKLEAFDSVFSMGVLYHRRSPIDHLLELKNCLKPGGELILETLVIDGTEGECLLPEGRYAKMGNVWFIPSTATLESWLRKCGYKNVRTVDVNITSTEEQRATEWMTFHSLKNFLNPKDNSKTFEGHPAPMRAVVIAEKP
ncbi:MAG: tRNA 5-methoxyuridine(34)/uridine 5-oxyacetic acid(34) synthase CmoB [Pseudomonadales bacterium]|nr:tRNA 5-methoxyuridine(34)/uridine 5-oxyacetic acid(34) synthase CmoB [Pseudomonadales bacterium]